MADLLTCECGRRTATAFCPDCGSAMGGHVPRQIASYITGHIRQAKHAIKNRSEWIARREKGGEVVDKNHRARRDIKNAMERLERREKWMEWIVAMSELDKPPPDGVS